MCGLHLLALLINGPANHALQELLVLMPGISSRLLALQADLLIELCSDTATVAARMVGEHCHQCPRCTGLSGGQHFVQWPLIVPWPSECSQCRWN